MKIPYTRGGLVIDLDKVIEVGTLQYDVDEVGYFKLVFDGGYVRHLYAPPPKPTKSYRTISKRSIRLSGEALEQVRQEIITLIATPAIPLHELRWLLAKLLMAHDTKVVTNEFDEQFGAACRSLIPEARALHARLSNTQPQPTPK